MEVLTAQTHRSVSSGTPGKRCGWQRFWLLSFVVVGLFLAFITTPVRAETSREYQLKAVFLFNFAQFTDWPTNAFTNSTAPIVIGILGEDPFGDFLDATVRGETVNGRKLEIQRFRRVEEIQTCHILFISGSEDRRLERILQALKARPILTVTDIEGPLTRGTMVRLLMEKNRIRIRIDMAPIHEAKLEVSSKLLRASDVVPEEKKP